MEKYFATYAQSLALKELGFKKLCFGWYEHSGNFYYCYQEGLVPPSPSKKLIKGCCLAPLKSQVFDWFRDNYQIEVTVACFYSKRLGISYEERLYHCHIIRDGITTKGHKFKTNGEAELACIDKLIEIVKNK